MVQSALLVALGFLTAMLLALLTAPVLWRRAQTVMRHRLESVVPMSLDEVRADRDALRAEHAMAMRRLQVENEEIRRIDAEHVIEIGRGKEALKARADTIMRRDKRIEQLERREEQVSAQLRKREKELSALEVSYRTASREVGRQRTRGDAIGENVHKLERETAERAALIAAHESEIAALGEELAEAKLAAQRLEAAASQSAEPSAPSVPVPLDADVTDDAMERDIALAAAEAKVRALEEELHLTDELLRGDISAVSERVLELIERVGTNGDAPERMTALIEDDAVPAMPRAADVATLPMAATLEDVAPNDGENEQRTGSERKAG